MPQTTGNPLGGMPLPPAGGNQFGGLPTGTGLPAGGGMPGGNPLGGMPGTPGMQGMQAGGWNSPGGGPKPKSKTASGNSKKRMWIGISVFCVMPHTGITSFVLLSGNDSGEQTSRETTPLRRPKPPREELLGTLHKVEGLVRVVICPP